MPKVSRHKNNPMLQWVPIYDSKIHVQDVSPQVNVERDPFGYVPQQNASGPVPTAFPHLFVPGSVPPTRQEQKISDDSQVVICTPMHRFVWSA